jgi:hypothetical protein
MSLDKSSKSKETYEEYSNSILIYTTIAYIIISIQTSIPSIKTNNSFPGCVKSFDGYPLEESKENKSGINYISCIIYKIKKDDKVFDVIKKMTEKTIASKLEGIISTNILNKNEYL